MNRRRIWLSLLESGAPIGWDGAGAAAPVATKDNRQVWLRRSKSGPGRALGPWSICAALIERCGPGRAMRPWSREPSPARENLWHVSEPTASGHTHTSANQNSGADSGPKMPKMSVTTRGSLIVSWAGLVETVCAEKATRGEPERCKSVANGTHGTYTHIHDPIHTTKVKTGDPSTHNRQKLG